MDTIYSYWEFWMPSKTFDIRNYVYLDLMTGKCVGHSYSQHLHHREEQKLTLIDNNKDVSLTKLPWDIKLHRQ